MPKLARASTNPALRAAFETHLEETQGQIERIDQIVEKLKLRLKRIKCAATATQLGKTDALKMRSSCCWKRCRKRSPPTKS